MKKKLIIYGYNSKNLGDDLMFSEIINKSSYDEYLFIGDKIVPSFLQKKISFLKPGRLLPLRWRWGSDFAIIGGSVLMGSSKPQLKMINQKLQWFKLNKRLGGKNFIIGANLGPYCEKKLYIEKLQQMSQYVSKWFVRDSFSKNILDEAEIADSFLMPDIVMGFELPKTCNDNGGSKEICVSVTEIDKDGKSRISAELYEQELADWIIHYIQKQYSCKFVSFEDKTDLPVIERIKSLIEPSILKHISTIPNTGTKVIVAIQKAEIVISTRFHCMVLSALAEKKQVIFSYSKKTTNFAEDYGFTTHLVTGSKEKKEPVFTQFPKDAIEATKDYVRLLQK